MPQLFTKDIALVQQFFESMCKVREQSLKNLTLNALKTSHNEYITGKSTVKVYYKIISWPLFSGEHSDVCGTDIATDFSKTPCCYL